MRKTISIIITLVICMKSYSQGQVIWQHTGERRGEIQTDLKYISKDTAYNSESLTDLRFAIKQKADTLEYIDISAHNTNATLYYWNNGKLGILENNYGEYLVGQYIAFHENGFIDSIGNFETVNDENRDEFFDRIEKICKDSIDTIFVEHPDGTISTMRIENSDCIDGFQDKEWYFFDKQGKIRMIKIYNKGVLVDVILPKEEEEETITE